MVPVNKLQNLTRHVRASHAGCKHCSASSTRWRKQNAVLAAATAAAGCDANLQGSLRIGRFVTDSWVRMGQNKVGILSRLEFPTRSRDFQGTSINLVEFRCSSALPIGAPFSRGKLRLRHQGPEAKREAEPAGTPGVKQKRWKVSTAGYTFCLLREKNFCCYTSNLTA